MPRPEWPLRLRSQASTRALAMLRGCRAPNPINHVSASARCRDVALPLTVPPSPRLELSPRNNRVLESRALPHQPGRPNRRYRAPLPSGTASATNRWCLPGRCGEK